jgi:hypothetical protein
VPQLKGRIAGCNTDVSLLASAGQFCIDVGGTARHTRSNMRACPRLHSPMIGWMELWPDGLAKAPAMVETSHQKVTPAMRHLVTPGH